MPDYVTGIYKTFNAVAGFIDIQPSLLQSRQKLKAHRDRCRLNNEEQI